MTIMQIKFLFSVLIVLFVVNCSDESNQKAKSNETKDNDVKMLYELKETSGQKLNSSVVVLYYGDTGRENSGYFEWLIFSNNPIVIPEISEPNMPRYLELPLEDTVNFIESRMSGKKIKKPILSFSSNWETGEYRFRATLVNAQEGDYVIFRRYAKKKP